MQPKTPKLLDDIRDAAAFIREVAGGKTLEDYRRERLLRQAKTLALLKILARRK